MRGFWHPHGHLLDGAFSDDGRFQPLATWDGETVMKLFRERLLARLIERHAISKELAQKLLACTHCRRPFHRGHRFGIALAAKEAFGGGCLEI